MQVYKDTPAYVNGVQAGDRILKIDDHDVRGIGLETAGKLMRGPVGAQIELSVLREGRHEPIQFEITREEIIIPTVESKILSDSRIGYIMISKFTEKTPNEILQTLAGLLEQDIRGIILDLRDNPGGELVAATQIADNFVPKGPIVYIDYRSGDEDVKNVDDSYLQLPLAVLVNEYSASAAEILAGAIQDTETGVLVGTTPFGKALCRHFFHWTTGLG
ncbi:S41 family peptidase [Desulfotruncus arcticus]